ncbi:MAG TPA: hypothetical protein VFQ54_09945 [Thermomicrobiales bacterium]|nr:hypothetical protein [Thermomicrobiales bacterium]
MLSRRTVVRDDVATARFHGTPDLDPTRRRGVMNVVKALVNQRSLFRENGKISLMGDRLLIETWQGEVLDLRRSDIAEISNEFSKEYGDYIGGAVKAWGAPVHVALNDGRSLYLLINQRWFSERTENREWTRRLDAWWSRTR